MTNILYNDLKTLIGASNLVPGEQYRITDYVTTISKADYTSGNHVFDVVVTALDVNTLYDYAKALQHEGDNYFDGVNFALWSIKYNIDNIIPGYTNNWVDPLGKGCIYYMADEFANEAPFDFKNIKHNGKYLYFNLSGTDNSLHGQSYDNSIKDLIVSGEFIIPTAQYTGNCYNIEFGYNCDRLTVYNSHDVNLGDNNYDVTIGNSSIIQIGDDNNDVSIIGTTTGNIGSGNGRIEIDNGHIITIGNHNNNVDLGNNNSGTVIGDSNNDIIVGTDVTGIVIVDGNTDITIGNDNNDVTIEDSTTVVTGNDNTGVTVNNGGTVTIGEGNGKLTIDGGKTVVIGDNTHQIVIGGGTDIVVEDDVTDVDVDPDVVDITIGVGDVSGEGTTIIGQDGSGSTTITNGGQTVVVDPITGDITIVDPIELPKDILRYSPQTLTPEQQLQARTNIGAGDYEVTYDDVVDALTYVPISTDKIGVANGLATLDAQGYVLNAQLPSYVDDIIEVDTFILLPTTGEKGKIYIVTDSGKTYRWATTQYVTISESLTLGTGSEQAYPGNLGAALRIDVDGKANTVHTHTKSEVGLANVDNTSDLTKPISTATQTALNGKADKGTTLADYEIADAYTQTEINTKLENIKHNDILNRNGDTNFLHITETEKTNFINASDFVEDFISNANSILYADLLALKNNGELIPGQKYRIIDYTTTTSQADTSVAGNDFDIVVVALSESVLSENASVVQRDGTTYFDGQKLSSWQIKYNLDNDDSKFAWANTSIGKGVIYRMIDEFNNDVPYDFKNIQFLNDGVYVFTFGGTTDDSLTGNSVGNIIKESIVSSKLSLNFNTFGTNCNFNILGFNNNNNTFGDYCNSNAFDAECRFNKFGDDCFYITFGNSCRFNTFSNESGSNTFGLNCWYNTFGDGCYSNNFGDGCISNNLSDYCSYNTFGNECTSNNLDEESTSNIFGDYCGNNTFGAECRHNKFGNNYYNNEFGNECSVNRFGTDCNSNIFGESCQYNTFGNDCDNNTFNNYYSSNTFGDYCSNNNFYHGISGTTPKQYIRYIVLEDGCSRNNFYSPLTTSGGAYLRRIRIKGLDNATPTDIIITLSETSTNYEWIISRAIDGTIQQYCPKDHTLDISNLQTNKANKATTLGGYNITNAYTKTEIDNKISAVFRYKGNVATYSALTALTGMVTGDVYNVTNTGINYAWTGSAWESLAGTIDLSAYLEKTEAADTYETIENVSSLNDTVSEHTGYISNLQTNKQNKLIAGDNIVFSDNVISADLDDYLKTEDAPSNNKTYGRKNATWSEIVNSGGGGGGMVNITWPNLKSLRDAGTLVPGQSYRITDYVCTTTTTDTRSAGNLFDIIVTALGNNKLSENASATYHEGDAYFSSNKSKLESWQLKYCIDNDANRFEWADTVNGKGVIYYMKDNYNNEVPYDFKNIQFKKNDVWLYTFGGATDNSVVIRYDAVYLRYWRCADNIIGADRADLSVNQNLKYRLLFNTFGHSCIDNTLGTDCTSNTFGNSCSNNNFGNNFNSNNFGDSCTSNKFGYHCNSNTFGVGCSSNTFGNSCTSNTFGNSCTSNKFGDICSVTTFGDNCSANTFGYGCVFNGFYTGSSGTTPKKYISYIVLEDNVQHNNFYSSLATSDSSYLQRIRIKGLENSTTQIALSTANTKYEWVICYTSGNVLKQYCPDD